MALRTTLCLSLVVFGLVAGCRSTPITGRKQLLVLPEQQEIAMGVEAYREILAEQPLSTNPHHAALVNQVGQRIAAVAGRPDYQWEFRVIASPEQNAFALPGGKVAIYEGLLPICGNEAGLAVVMSHEIGHALARHGGERMAHAALAQGVGHGVDIASQNQAERDRARIREVYGAASQYGFMLPYSREHELEADAIGLTLMAQAGYDPREAPQFWQRFAASKQGNQPIEFLSTHPSDQRRADELNRMLPQALALYQSAPAKYGQGVAIATLPAATIAVQPVPRSAVTPAASFDSGPGTAEAANWNPTGGSFGVQHAHHEATAGSPAAVLPHDPFAEPADEPVFQKPVEAPGIARP